MEGTQDLWIAKKTLVANLPDTVSEIQILKNLRNNLLLEQWKEIQIATAISTIKEGLKVHVLSLCAEMDLDAMLKQPPNPNCDIRDPIKEVRGISRALEFLHDKLKTESDGVVSSYCHLDLKPANILVFMQIRLPFPSDNGN